MECRHSGSPRPKKFRVQKSAGKVLASMFWDQVGIFPLVIFKRAKLSTRSITHLCWCNERHFGGKSATWKLQRCSCSCTTIPRLTWYLQPRRKWPTWASSLLITHPILRIWPRWTTTCSLDWKDNWKVVIFLSTRRLLLPRRPAWTDNVLNFF